mgnify:CR=1 FL=1
MNKQISGKSSLLPVILVFQDVYVIEKNSANSGEGQTENNPDREPLFR